MGSATASVNGKLWGARARDWAQLQEHQLLPVFATVLGELGLRPGSTLLDVGCGAGLVGQLAASRGVNVSAIDAAEEMVAVARERVPDGDLRVGDLEELPFESDTFDAVTGFNSFQYAAQPARALAEAKRVARAGAPIVLVTWGRPEAMPAAALVGALRPLLPPPPPGAPGPFALSEESALRALMQAGGLEVETIADVTSMWRYPDLEHAVRAFNSAGVAERAIQATSEEAVSRVHADALAPFAQPDGTYAVEATFRYGLARA